MYMKKFLFIPIILSMVTNLYGDYGSDDHDTEHTLRNSYYTDDPKQSVPPKNENSDNTKTNSNNTRPDNSNNGSTYPNQAYYEAPNTQNPTDDNHYRKKVPLVVPK